MDVGDLTVELLEASLNEAFTLVSEPEPVELILTEVNRLSTTPDGRGSSSAFSAVFSGPSEPLYEQSIRTLHSVTLGDLDIFLVPVGRDNTAATYEAVFTRIDGEDD